MESHAKVKEGVPLNESMPCVSTDKNECIDRNSCTNGQCINTNGSFLCKCNAGFTQDIFNQYHCEGNWTMARETHATMDL